MQNRRPLVKRLSLSLVELPILRHAAAIHYTSEAERNEAAALRPEISSFPSFILPIPVESPPEPVDAESFAKEFPSASGKKIILFLSRLDPKKGLEILIEAFAAISESEPDALLVLAGDGNPDYAQSLRTLAERLGGKAKILWPGHLGPQQKAAAFAAATLFVLPSYSENFGIAAAEAMAAGVPTVITDQVALAEYASKYDAALVVRPDPDALIGAIRSILRDDQLGQRFAENGWRLVEEMFSPRAIGTQLDELYERLVATNAKRSVGT
jgi:glycosyltransferase involved in cell wall biosynthesis